jgi:hypothetical protein
MGTITCFLRDAPRGQTGEWQHQGAPPTPTTSAAHRKYETNMTHEFGDFSRNEVAGENESEAP